MLDDRSLELNTALLAELSSLFCAESFEKDLHGDPEEADRLWDIAAELQEQIDDPERRSSLGGSLRFDVRVDHRSAP